MKRIALIGFLVGALSGPSFAGPDPRGILELEGYGNSDPVGITAKRGRNDFTIKETLASGDKLFFIGGYGYNGTAFGTNAAASMEFSASQAWTSTANGSKIIFKTTPDGSVTPATALTINSTQTVILATNTYAVTDGGQTLYHVTVSTSLADTQEYVVNQMNGKLGGGTLIAVGHASACTFGFLATGVVTLADHTNCNVTNNNDTTLNVYDSGTTITIENQLGATYTLLLDIWYVN